MSTYSSRPWISKDGLDEHGVRAEVKVVMGFGDIASIEPSAAGKAQKFSFRVDNTKYDSSGWAQTDSAVHQKVLEAQAADEPIHFRIETRRKPGIDRTLPISEIGSLASAKDSIVKSLAAVRREGEEDWTVGQMVTRFDEDPKTSANGIVPASQMTPEELGRSKAAEGAAGGYSLEPSATMSFTAEGEVNLEADGVGALFSMLKFARSASPLSPGAEGAAEKHATVAKLLLVAANELQLSLYAGKLEKPDLSLRSHATARAIVQEVVEAFYPFTMEVLESRESLLAWKDSISAKGAGIYKWSLSEVK